MIEISDQAASVLLSGNQTRRIRVESWYDDQLLDDDVPVTDGREETDRSLNVPERVTLTVPRTRRGVDYTPGELLSPLAANGQRLRILVGVGIGNGQYEWLQRGWFVITNSVRRGDQISVEAAGMLWLIQEARLVNPFQPSTNFVTSIRALVEPALTVEFDSALVDRSIPSTVNYDDDRLGALETTLTAWGAVADVTPDGFLYVTSSDDPATVSLELSSGVRGTVIQSSGESTRDGVFNAVVAQGTATDGGLVRSVAYDLNGPKRSGGPFNDLPVPFYFDSPLITTQAQAAAAARTRLATIKRGTGIMKDVEMVPHPALEVGDRVTLDGVDGIVEQYTLPLTAAGGAATAKVRLVES